jgi:hypothetical protein
MTPLSLPPRIGCGWDHVSTTFAGRALAVAAGWLSSGPRSTHRAPLFLPHSTMHACSRHDPPARSPGRELRLDRVSQPVAQGFVDDGSYGYLRAALDRSALAEVCA